jgi:hypothetical protein
MDGESQHSVSMGLGGGGLVVKVVVHRQVDASMFFNWHCRLVGRALKGNEWKKPIGSVE